MGYNSKKIKDQGAGKSVIISALDSAAEKIYGLLGSGLFGRFFTSYSADSGRIAGKLSGKSGFADKVGSFRRTVARKIESCAAHSLYVKIIRYMLSFRLRVYGTAVLTFFLYASAVSIYKFLMGDMLGIPVNFIILMLFAAASVPLAVSGDTLYEALGKSRIGRAVLAVTGNRPEGYETFPPCGRCNIAFLAGTILGLATYFVPAGFMCRMIFRGIWTLIVFHSPEFGIVSLCFLMPFDSTMTLVAEVGIVILSFIMKLILGKRTVRLEAVDMAALMFALMMFVGGVFSVSRSSSLKPMLVYLCFMSVYFLIVSLMRSDEWLGRCIIAAVCAGALVAAYGIFQYATGIIGFSTQWLDSEMFEDISGRAISTLENPNVLGEYLIMIIPMAASLFLCRYPDMRKKLLPFAAFACMCLCLVFTWSRGAWLGMIAGAVVFCLIWNKRCLHLFWVALLSLPFLPTILPDNILARITSIGNVADTSTAYRLNIWLGAIKMLPDRIFSGIGIGNGAWKLVYPHYALTGMTEAQHSHSLYFQIWIELGALALVIFIAFIVMLFMSNFTMYKSLSEAGDSLILRIYTAPVKETSRFVKIDSEKLEDSRVRRARRAMRMNAAGPLCGITGVLVQGFTDNMWYNYRVYFMFWICLGLCAAYASFGRERIVSGDILLRHEGATRAVADINLTGSAGKSEKPRMQKKEKDGI